MITPFSTGKENSTGSDENDKISTAVLQSTPSRKPFGSLKGSENKNSLSSGPKRVLLKQHDISKPLLNTPGKILKDGSTPSRYNYMQATEASKSLMPSPQRDPKCKQPSIARTPTRPSTNPTSAKPSPQSNRKSPGGTLRYSPVKSSKLQQPSSPNKQQLASDRIKPGKLNLKVHEASGPQRTIGSSGGSAMVGASARVSKASSSSSTRISRTTNNPSARPASATSTAAFGLKRATNSSRQVVSKNSAVISRSKLPTSTMATKSKSTATSSAATTASRRPTTATTTTTTGRTTATISKQSSSTTSSSKTTSSTVIRPSNAVGLQQRLARDRARPSMVSDSFDKVVPPIPPVSTPAPASPSMLSRQTSDCLENGVGEKFFVSGQSHTNNTEDFSLQSLQSLSFDMNLKPNMSFSSDVSSVDFKPESRSQSIDYSLRDIVRDEQGLLSDDKVNLSKNDLSAITVDFDISASNSIEIITPSFMSQATNFDVVNPPFHDSHPPFDRVCEDGVRDSITTVSVLHSTVGSVPSCWTDLENLANDGQSSHRSFSAVVLQSTESLPKSIQSTQDSLQSNDPLNLGMLGDISLYDENGENLDPSSVSTANDSVKINICRSLSSSQDYTDGGSTPREALLELDTATLNFSFAQSKASVDASARTESDANESMISIQSTTTSNDSSVANIDWAAVNTSGDLDTSFSRGCMDPVACHLNGGYTELQFFTDQFQPIVC